MSYEISQEVKDFVKSLTVLCVEDNKTTQIFYENIFYNNINKLIIANDGNDGYDKYLNNSIDIIVTDYHMPNLNGIEMIRKIRKVDSDIPIILVSSIEELDVIVEALRFNVNNFIKKPLNPDEIMNSIVNTSKILIANKYIEEQREKRVNELEEKKQYNDYQENLAFSKELNILRNDFYYQYIDMECTSIIDFFYKPLDIMSGDAYSVRKINNEITFYLIVDGMGKGLSASLSSMIMTSFINHLVDVMINTQNFDLFKIIEDSINYMKPILLDEEALAVDFVTINCSTQKMHYAKFAMPSILLQNQKNEIIRLKSNNQPLSKYIQDFNIASYSMKDISKFIIYSDGIVENETIHEGKLYSEFIENDFLESFTRLDMQNQILETTKVQEDDMTFIFFNKMDLKHSIIKSKVFSSSLEVLDIANDWYADVWNKLTDDIKLIYSASLVFTELFMNAYEHGSLGLSNSDKHKLMEEDTYFESLKKMEIGCDKKISVSIHEVMYDKYKYVITQISDEGKGFNTDMLMEIFRNEKTFNGRGVLVSKNSSSGIYYNSIGNSVLYIHKVEV